jgi:two-component system, OmpR family, sensor histidine kinase MprB
MGLRTRLTLLAAGVVGITVVLAAVVCYLAMRGELRKQVDDALGRQGGLVVRAPGTSIRPPDRFTVRVPAPPPRAGGSAPYVQVLDTAGKVQRRIDTGLPAIPVSARDRRVAAGKATGYLSDRVVDGDHVRVNTVRTMGGGALQLGRSLSGVDSTLLRLRWVLIALCLAGTALAAALGRLFSRPVMQPVTDLTDAAEHITATEDLARRVDARGDDEVGRMAARFNTMLDTLEGSRAALDDSVEAQRRLVADASHELRTPVTSLRTNVEVLLAGHDLPEATRQRLLEDVRAQTEELSALITDVIELARGDVPLSGVEDVRLDDLVSETVARVGRHHPGTGFSCTLEPSVVEGLPDRLGRAVANLLDNAAKYGPPDGVVSVVVDGGEVTVRDHGPGVPAAEAPFVFDRFYRGARSRGRHGSGLGLAIVRQVAEAHGGSVGVEEAVGGGAVFRLRLPAGVEGPGELRIEGEHEGGAVTSWQ